MKLLVEIKNKIMTTQEFLQRLEELYKSNLEISRAKNKDYAGDGDPFKNFKLCEQLGICLSKKEC